MMMKTRNSNWNFRWQSAKMFRMIYYMMLFRTHAYSCSICSLVQSGFCCSFLFFGDVCVRVCSFEGKNDDVKLKSRLRIWLFRLHNTDATIVHATTAQEHQNFMITTKQQLKSKQPKISINDKQCAVSQFMSWAAVVAAVVWRNSLLLSTLDVSPQYSYIKQTKNCARVSECRNVCLRSYDSIKVCEITKHQCVFGTGGRMCEHTDTHPHSFTQLVCIAQYILGCRYLNHFCCLMFSLFLAATAAATSTGGRGALTKRKTYQYPNQAALCWVIHFRTAWVVNIFGQCVGSLCITDGARYHEIPYACKCTFDEFTFWCGISR